MKKLMIVLTMLSSLSALACESSICKGDRVNFSDYVGTAVEVFNNGNVKIAVDGYYGYSFKTISELGKGVKCHKNVCANNRVNFSDYVGTAVEVFNNGKIKIAVDGYYGHSFKAISQIGIGYRCSGKLCQGDRVNFSDYVGTVDEIFNNGNVKIDVDGYYGYSYRTVSQLGYELECHN